MAKKWSRIQRIAIKIRIHKGYQLNLFKYLFTERIIIYVSINYIEVVNLDTNYSIQEVAKEPFTTQRLLIGNIEVAAKLSRQLVNRVRRKRMLKSRLRIIVQPLDLVEGGLSSVEKNAFGHLAFLAGAREIFVVCTERRKISNSEALQYFEARQH